jgi:hypothetical protein
MSSPTIPTTGTMSPQLRRGSEIPADNTTDSKRNASPDDGKLRLAHYKPLATWRNSARDRWWF